MQVMANGISINYVVNGREDAPWVTFITCIGNDASMWDGQIAELEDDFRILRIDSRGHGGTHATEGDYTFDVLIGDVLGVWDALHIQKSHLVGLGLGGSSAIGLAIDHSDRLLSLVPTACRDLMVPELAAIWPDLIDMARAGGMTAVAETTVERWFTDEFKAGNPGVLYSVRSQIISTEKSGYFGCIAAFMTLNFQDRIDQISVPTLFVSGANDARSGPPDVMQELADKVPGARHTSVADATYICNMQNPDGYNKVIGEFLRDHATG